MLGVAIPVAVPVAAPVPVAGEECGCPADPAAVGHCGPCTGEAPNGDEAGVSGRGPSGISGACEMTNGGGFCTVGGVTAGRLVVVVVVLVVVVVVVVVSLLLKNFLKPQTSRTFWLSSPHLELALSQSRSCSRLQE